MNFPLFSILLFSYLLLFLISLVQDTWPKCRVAMVIRNKTRFGAVWQWRWDYSPLQYTMRECTMVHHFRPVSQISIKM